MLSNSIISFIALWTYSKTEVRSGEGWLGAKRSVRNREMNHEGRVQKLEGGWGVNTHVTAGTESVQTRDLL